MIYVGMDLHKNYHQIALVDDSGEVLANEKIDNTTRAINKFFKEVPLDSKVVMESSSVWYNVYSMLEDKGYDVTLSNPLKTKAIASAKIKTDKIDAVTLANLLKGELIAECYVAPPQLMKYRKIVRHRKFIVYSRTNIKNKIHGILLLNGIKIPGDTFTQLYVKHLRKLKDYRIDGYLNVIDTMNIEIDTISKRIDKLVRSNEDAQLLTSIPGIGNYTALSIVGEIGDVKRFPDSHKLCSYAGLVPSTHSSGGVTHHGPITKFGSTHLRWVLTEAIRVHVRVHKDTELAHYYYRMFKRKGMSKSTVAAAAKLLRIIYWMLWDKRKYVASYSG